MHNAKSFLGSAAIAASVLVGCSGAPEPVGHHQSGSAQAALATTLDFDLVCDQSVGFFPADPTVARAELPAEYDLYYRADGHAEVLGVLQDCSSAIWDGTQIGPLKMFHFWIRRVGPPEQIPIAGTVFTQPTDYWYLFHDYTDSRQLVLAGKKAGVNYVLADISIGAVGTSRVSRVVEKDLPKGSIGFTWTQTGRTSHPYAGYPIGIRHRIVSLQGWTPDDPNDLEKFVSAHDRGIVVPEWQYASITLTPDAKSLVAGFGELTTPGLDMALYFTATFTTTELEE